ncbi:uncharacterized protein LOC117812036 isoform X1 [Notolabrus celidotus]|uniref:uncharacterized protein LOC117812036 isoform X1 n=1 Tax=Notolabrus celidotus TaxID=1203425 RepID=UPI00149039F8|nr:uncharacterized protein LOC117812036 isoform X1 [Notolabrus celidotus]
MVRCHRWSVWTRTHDLRELPSRWTLRFIAANTSSSVIQDAALPNMFTVEKTPPRLRLTHMALSVFCSPPTGCVWRSPVQRRHGPFTSMFSQGPCQREAADPTHMIPSLAAHQTISLAHQEETKSNPQKTKRSWRKGRGEEAAGTLESDAVQRKTTTSGLKRELCLCACMRQPASHTATPAAVNQQAIIAFDDNVVSRREQQLSLMRSAPSQSVSGPIRANTIAS